MTTKLLILLLILTISSKPSYGQCDSLLIISEMNSIDNLNDVVAKVSASSKFIGRLIECRFYQEAIRQQIKKVKLAKNRLPFNEEYRNLLLLDTLLLSNKKDMSVQLKDSFLAQSIIAWADFNDRTGFHMKTIEKFDLLKSKFFVKTDEFPDELIISLERAMRDIGIEYLKSREYGIAIDYFKQAFLLCDQLKNEESRLARSSLNRGFTTFVYLETENLPNSIQIFYDHLRLSKKLFKINRDKYVDHLNTAYKRLARLHLMNNNLDSAAYYISEFERLESEYFDSNYESSVLTARLHLHLGNYTEASVSLRTLFNFIDLKNKNSENINFGKNLTVANMLIEANMPKRANVLLKFIEAINNERIEIRDANQPNYYSNEIIYLDILLSSLRVYNDFSKDSMISKIKDAYQIIDNSMKKEITRKTKLDFASQSAEFTEYFLEILMDQNTHNAEDIFFGIESSKAATSTKSWLQNQLANFHNEDGIFLRERELEINLQSLKMELKVLKDTIQNQFLDLDKILHQELLIKQKYSSLNSLKRKIEQLHPIYYKMKYNWSIPKLSNVQASLAPDEVLLNYFEGQEILYVMVIAKNYSRTVLIDSVSTLRDSITQNWKNIQNEKHWTVNLSTTSNYIYQKIVEPLEPYLKDRIIVSPSGSLFQVQFDALNTSSDSENPYYLINDHAISYVPSATLFHQMRKMNTNNVVEKALLVAPEFSSKSKVRPTNLQHAMRAELYPLDFNVPEVEAISKYFDNDLLIKGAAIKDSALAIMPHADIIHLSTHAKSNMDSPDKSYVAFSNTNQKIEEHEYKWYLDEMSMKQLTAKMIVLSACETGLGQVYKGEGAMSLANSCFYAGAQSVVASLWLAADNASKDIMTNLYSNLDQGLSKDKALQKSKIDYLENNSGSNLNPYYWAGFSVMGNTTSLRFKRTPNYRNWLYALFGAIAIFLFFLQIRSAIKK